jgi:hypothetical protein
MKEIYLQESPNKKHFLIDKIEKIWRKLNDEGKSVQFCGSHRMELRESPKTNEVLDTI